MTPVLRTFTTSRLDVACEVSGPEGGKPVLLLHGWPDDVRTWDGIVPALHGEGWRTYVPYLRGYGPTRFRDAATMRSGQLTALAQDALELADAAGLGDEMAIVGHDWGARAAYIAAVLAPERVRRVVALSVGWGTNDPTQKLSLQQTQNYWYHWFMALERGAEVVRDERRALTRHIWKIWNPGWAKWEEGLAQSVASFDNPDWAEITVHSYRHRWGLAASDPAYAEIEARVKGMPGGEGPALISVPTLCIHGGGDPVNDPSTSEGKERFFTGGYRREVVDGVGHFPQREAPAVVAELILRWLGG